jgi:hypothetical protein
LAVLVGLVVASCGGDSGAEPDATAPEASFGFGRVVETTSGAEPVDACSLLTAADASSILGVEPIVTVEFPFRIREDRTGGPEIDQPELLGECLWMWEVPEGEAFELAQVQFYVWDGDTFFAAPPIDEGAEALAVGDRGRLVTVASQPDNAVYLVDFVAGGKTVWLDASVWRNPDALDVLVEISQRIAGALG